MFGAYPLHAQDSSGAVDTQESNTIAVENYLSELRQEVNTRETALAARRKGLNAALQAYLSSEPDASYEELTVMQAAFMRQNFEEYVLIEAEQGKLDALKRVYAYRAKQLRAESIELASEGAAELQEAYKEMAEQLIRLEQAN